MSRYYKFIEIAYLIVALIFIYEGVTRFYTEREKSYMFLGFAVLAVFMYFFKKRFRKRFEERRKNQEKK